MTSELPNVKMSLREVRRTQARLFREASKTYYGASRFFSRATRRDVTTLYAFVRTVDTFVDQVPQDAEGFFAFRQRYTEELDRAVPSHSIEGLFVELLRRVNIDSEWVEAFFEVMASDLDWQPKQTPQDTIDYMYGSAEVIGLMMARVLQLPQEAFSAAQFMGRSMQYANFLRDIQEDQQLRRTYFSQETLAQYGLSSLSEEATRAQKEAFTFFFREQVHLYEAWRQQGEKGYVHLPIAARVAIETASSCYTWTLRTLSEDPFRVYTEQLKPSRGHVGLIGLSMTARAMWQAKKRLLLISRPRFWLYLAGPYTLGALFGVSSGPEALAWQHLTLFFFFLIPANLFLYGVNDLADRDTDAQNTKKDGQREWNGARTSSTFRRWLMILCGLCGGLGVGISIAIGHLVAGVLLGAFLLLAIAYSVAPIRLKARPVLDMVSNVLYVIPGWMGFVLASDSWPFWAALLGSATWAMAMQLFSALPDIAVDRAAELRTTAVVFGRSVSTWICVGLWSVAVACAFFAGLPWWVATIGLIYPITALFSRSRTQEQLTRLYWWFPWINGGVGMVLTFYALWRLV